MRRQTITINETLPTNPANPPIVPRMDLHMSSKITRPCEFALTNATLVIFLPTVFPLMHCQNPLDTRFVFTFIALEFRFGMHALDMQH